MADTSGTVEIISQQPEDRNVAKTREDSNRKNQLKVKAEKAMEKAVKKATKKESEGWKETLSGALDEDQLLFAMIVLGLFYILPCCF